MTSLSRHTRAIIFIAAMLGLCLGAWVALAGLVVVNYTDVPARVSHWLGRAAATVSSSPSLPDVDVFPPATPEQATAPARPTLTIVLVASATPADAAVTPTPAGAQSPRGADALSALLPTSTLAPSLAPGTMSAVRPTTTPDVAPLSPTPGDTPDAAIALRPTAAPTVAPSPTPSPTPTRATFNLILLGSDRNIPGKGTWRTDVMALTVMDRETREVGVLAMPRDLYVSIPGHPPERLNTVDFLGHYTKYPGGGPALLDRTLRQNFGFGFDRFVRIDFTGFVELVDILGGLDIDVDCPFEERFADPEVPGGRLLKLEPGRQHLDGYTTLMYVRSRLTTSDLDRSRRQFKVLMALREKILQLNTLLLIPQLWNNYRVTVQTDLSLGEALDLARLAYEFDANDIHGQVIDPSMTIPGRTALKSWVLLPRHNKIKKAYDELFSAPSLLEAGRHRGRCP